MLSAGTSHSHYRAASVPQRCLHVAKVEVDVAVAVHRNEFRDALHSIFQHIVGTFESLFQRYSRVAIDITEPLVVHYQQRIDVFSHFLNTAQGLYYLAFALEVERNGDHTYGEYASLASHLCHHRGSTGARATAHSGGDEHHLGAVVEQMAYVLDVAFRLLTTHFRLRSGTKSLAELYLHGNRRARQRLTVGVAHGESHALHTFVIHVADGVLSASADTNHLYYVLRKVVNRSKI